MSGVLIIIFTVVMVIVSGMIILLVLMQRPSANAGMGSALGGGAAESAFGAQTGNILTRATIVACAIFFMLAFGLYLGHMADLDKKDLSTEALNDELTAGSETDSGDTSTISKATTGSLTDLSAAIEAEIKQSAEKAEEEEGPGLPLNSELNLLPDGELKVIPPVEESESGGESKATSAAEGSKSDGEPEKTPLVEDTKSK